MTGIPGLPDWFGYVVVAFWILAGCVGLAAAWLVFKFLVRLAM